MAANRPKVSYFEMPLSAHQAKEKAQWIAFAPVVFKIAVSLRRFGVIQALYEAAPRGLTFDEVLGKCEIPIYGLRILIDSGIQCGLVSGDDHQLELTDTGFFLLSDAMTVANLDFVNDVCYKGFAHFEEAIATGKPAGLRELGDYRTIYEGLSSLSPDIQRSWLAFDHYFSDTAFQEALPFVFRYSPRCIMDIGGNTGKFSKQCLAYSPAVEMTIVDLPGQIGMAQQQLSSHPEFGRMHFHAADMLNPESSLPTGHDMIWMSQFLDCFSEAEIVAILTKCRLVMTSSSRVLIMEPLTDRQQAPANAFCVELTSPYFTCMANGNSRMYRLAEMTALVEQAGMRVAELSPILGVCQTVMVCQL
jgi:O-methyltransferase domain